MGDSESLRRRLIWNDSKGPDKRYVIHSKILDPIRTFSPNNLRNGEEEKQENEGRTAVVARRKSPLISHSLT
jgi:hypothetical protein